MRDVYLYSALHGFVFSFTGPSQPGEQRPGTAARRGNAAKPGAEGAMGRHH
jgi:hypothetical protein